MKKAILLFLIGLMCWDPSAAPEAATATATAGNSHTFVPSDLDDFAKPRRRKKKRRKSAKGSEMGIVASPSLTLALPMGDMGDGLKMGFGAGVDGAYAVMPEVLVGLSTGFHRFGYKDSDVEGFTLTGNHTYVPVMVQGAYLVDMEPIRPYAGLGAGLFLGSSYTELGMEVLVGNDPGTGAPVFETIVEKTNDKATEVGISPFAGVYYSISDNMHLNFCLRYNNVFSTAEEIQEDLSVKEVAKTNGYVSINIGIAISLGN
ncbi:MAG TPA: outer membrane beta-barrel protein [Bacteroidales bacterium]|nr:outer membrane beta-barrel protein [Bacteroidales bacterium]